MPKGFEVKDFLRSVIIFTLVIESLGALSLYIAFSRAGVEHNFAIWSSIFHSISAFCTAGFGLYNDSFEQYAADPYINGILSFLSVCGALGFIVVTDVWNRIIKKTEAITFTTRIIIVIMSLLIILGTGLLYFFEPTMDRLGAWDKFLAAFFQAMTSVTTVGFNTVPIGNFILPVLLIVTFLMYVGASPSGTGGGLKSTTLTALMAIMWSRIRGDKRVTFFGKTIPLERMYVATSTFILYATILFISTFLISLTEKFSLQEILFEVTSAIGTVGLSTGITADLSGWSKLVLIFTMFVGRLGVLTFGLAVLARRKNSISRKEIVDLAV